MLYSDSLLSIYFYFYACVCCLHEFMLAHVCWYLSRPVVWSGVPGGCEPPRGCWEPRLGLCKNNKCGGALTPGPSPAPTLTKRKRFMCGCRSDGWALSTGRSSRGAGSIPSTHTAAHNCIDRVHRHPCRHTCTQE